MKSFFKFTFASILGFIIGGLLLLFIGIGLIAGIAASTEKTVTVKNNSILQLKLQGQIPDRTVDSPFSNFDFASMQPKKSISLMKVLKGIEKAKTDNKIKGIYLNLNGVSSNFGSMATIDEIRAKLLDFKSTGKFILSYNNFGYSQKSYYLCSVADSIFMNPEANFTLLGLGGVMSFYKKFLAKLGIEPEVIRHGKFKAAVEPFLTDKMSDANREQTMKYIGSMWSIMMNAVSTSRNISVEKLNLLTDNLTVRDANTALSNNLVDALLYEDQMISKLKKLVDIKESKKLRLINLSEYSSLESEITEFHKNKIAIIYASGEIKESKGDNVINSSLALSIRKARKDTTIKAIVLRVNSPGGSALVSDIIWREVELAKRVKPVIASMGNVAASGGYYIACAAHTIVADPNTITGSIGVFGLIFNGEDLIKNKMGISTDNFGTNKYSNFGGGYPLGLPLSSRKLTPFERSIIQTSVEEIYTKFITKVANGRSMTIQQVDEIGQGRVWNALDAKEIGLVDEIGGIERALEIAKEKAGLENYRIVSFPKQKNKLTQILKGLTTQIKTNLLENELGLNYRALKQAKDVLKMNGIQARIPYNLEIN